MQQFLLNLLLAFRNLKRHARRSTFSIGAATFGIVALLIASGFVQWIFLGMREATIRSHYGHLQINRPGFVESGKSDPYRFLFSDDIAQVLSENFTGDSKEHILKAIVPRLSFSGLISHGEATLSFIGEGVSPAEAVHFGDALQISKGKHLRDEQPEQFIIGEGLARNLGVTVGDKVVLMVNTVGGGINAIEVTVGGLFNTVTQSYDENAIRIPLETAQQLLRTTGVHSWIVLLENTEYTDPVLETLRKILPDDRYEIVPWYALSDFYNKTVVLFGKQVLGIKLIIAIIILLSILNVMAISVMERTGEIGTAMAIGVKRSGIMGQFLSEGILIGLIGGVIGLVIGYLLAIIISSIGIPMPPPPGMARGYTGEILVTPDMAIESLVLVVVTTMIASLYPAWKASRMRIVDALRHNR